jgi:hypothetical protein
MIAPTELTHNYERLNTPYYPNQPIGNIYQHIQDSQAVAVATRQRYGNVMIINCSLMLVADERQNW